MIKIQLTIEFTGHFLEPACRWQSGRQDGDLEGGLGIYHAGARMYDPEEPRFYGVDAMRSKMPGWNAYHYTFNNPVKYVDPDGNMPGDYFNRKGEFIGNDGIDDDKVYIAQNRGAERRTTAALENNDVEGARSNSTFLGTRTALTEADHVLQRTLDNGGLSGESSLVLDDGTVLRGETGPPVQPGDAVATETLPGIPMNIDLSTITSIHSHITSVVNGLSGNATEIGPGDPMGLEGFGNNIIVGPLNRVAGSRPLGAAFFNKNPQSRSEPRTRVKRSVLTNINNHFK